MKISELEKKLTELKLPNYNDARRGYIVHEFHKILRVMKYNGIYSSIVDSENHYLEIMEKFGLTKRIEIEEFKSPAFKNIPKLREYSATKSGMELYMDFVEKFPAKPAK